MPPSESSHPDPSTESTDSDANSTPKRDLAQYLGAIAVLSGIALVFGASFGWVEYNEPGVRIIVIGGVALVLGWRAQGGIG